jgi:hypothetical protein
VPHEPCGFVGDAQHAVALMGAHALLAAANEMEGGKPLGQGYATARKPC